MTELEKLEKEYGVGAPADVREQIKNTPKMGPVGQRLVEQQRAQQFAKENIRPFVDATLDATSFGLNPQLEGGWEAGKTALGYGRKGESAKDAYERRRVEVVNARNERVRNSPTASALGTGTGAVVAGLGMPAGFIKSAQLGRALVAGLEQASLGAVQGALSGLGYEQPKTMEEAFAIIAKHGGIGGIVGGLFGVGGEGVASLITKMRQPVQKLSDKQLADDILYMSTKARERTAVQPEWGGPEGNMPKVRAELQKPVGDREQIKKQFADKRAPLLAALRQGPGKTMRLSEEGARLNEEIRASFEKLSAERARVMEDAAAGRLSQRDLETRLTQLENMKNELLDGYSNGRNIKQGFLERRNELNEGRPYLEAEDKVMDLATTLNFAKEKAQRNSDMYQQYVSETVQSGGTPVKFEQFIQERGIDHPDLYALREEYEAARNAAERIRGKADAGTVKAPRQVEEIQAKLQQLYEEEQKALAGTLRPREPENTLRVTSTEYGDQRAVHGVDPSNPNRYMMSTIEGGRIKGGYVDNGGQPGMSGPYADAVSPYGPISGYDTPNVVNTPTLRDLEMGVPASDTQVGKFMRNVGENMGMEVPSVTAARDATGKMAMTADYTPAQQFFNKGAQISAKLKNGEPLTADEMRIVKDFIENANTNRNLPGSAGKQKLQNMLSGKDAIDWFSGAAGGAVGHLIGGVPGAIVGGGVGTGISKMGREAIGKPTPLPYRMPGEPDIKVAPTRVPDLAKKAGPFVGNLASIFNVEMKDEEMPQTLRDTLMQTDINERIKGKSEDTQNNTVTDENGIRYLVTDDGSRIRVD